MTKTRSAIYTYSSEAYYVHTAHAVNMPCLSNNLRTIITTSLKKKGPNLNARDSVTLEVMIHFTATT